VRVAGQLFSRDPRMQQVLIVDSCNRG